jgi:hypothetical protein
MAINLSSKARTRMPRVYARKYRHGWDRRVIAESCPDREHARTAPDLTVRVEGGERGIGPPGARDHGVWAIISPCLSSPRRGASGRPDPAPPVGPECRAVGGGRHTRDRSTDSPMKGPRRLRPRSDRVHAVSHVGLHWSLTQLTAPVPPPDAPDGALR